MLYRFLIRCIHVVLRNAPHKTVCLILYCENRYDSRTHQISLRILYSGVSIRSTPAFVLAGWPAQLLVLVFAINVSCKHKFLFPSSSSQGQVICVQQNAQKLKINGKNSREDVLGTRWVSAGDFGIYTPSISLIASEQTVIAAESALQTFPRSRAFRRKCQSRFHAGWSEFCERTTAAVRSNNNKTTTTATAKKHPPTEDSRWAITRSTCSTPCFMCRLVQLRELDESAAQFAHSPRTCVASVLSVCERASKQASAWAIRNNTRRRLTLNHCECLCFSLQEPKSEHVGTPTRSFHLSGRQDDECWVPLTAWRKRSSDMI